MREKILDIVIKISFKCIQFELISLVILTILFKFSNPNSFNKKEILSLLISTIAIIVAIIVTYLFSKLFAEKTERIQRKVEIDNLAHKVTALRKIAFHIRGFYEFWKFGKNDVKGKIDFKYKTLTYEDLRNDKLSYEEFSKIIKDVGETALQGYLAIKGLEDRERSIVFFLKFTPRNYSLDQIIRFEEYTNSFWYLLDKSDSSVVNFKKENSYSLKFIDELYLEITGKEIDKTNYNKQIEELFSYYESEIFQKLYYLTKLNSKQPKLFLHSLINMFMFVILLVFSLIIFIADLTKMAEYFYTIFIVSFFTANTIDLLIITIKALKSELKIEDFYSI